MGLLILSVIKGLLIFVLTFRYKRKRSILEFYNHVICAINYLRHTYTCAQGVFCVYMCIDIVDVYQRRNFYLTCQELITQSFDQAKSIAFGTGAGNHKVQGPL